MNASQPCDDNDISKPYTLHKREMNQDLHSTGMSKSTDDMTTSTMNVDEQPPPSYNYTMAEEPEKPCIHNYFRDNSNGSSSDYPTDEQTLNTLNSLNSHHKHIFGMDDAVVEGDAAAMSSLQHMDDYAGMNIDSDAYDHMHDIRAHNSNQDTHNDSSNDSSNSSSSMHNNMHSSKNRPNRFHVLEMAKKRMASVTARNSVVENAIADVAPCTPEETIEAPFATGSQHQDKGDDSSFLADAIIARVNPTKNSSFQYQSHKITSDTSTISSYYNVHASTLSQSTKTSSSNKHPLLPIGFVNVGGDASIYSSPKETYDATINPSFETTHTSPSTVVASGSRPRVTIDSSTSGSAESSNENTTVESGTASGTTSSESNNRMSAQDLYKSTMIAAGRPIKPFDSLANNDGLDDMILHESNLAVQHLGTTSPRTQRNFTHSNTVIEAAAAAHLRKTTDAPSLDTYSYNQAFQTTDNITSHPELPSVSTENPFAPNLPEDYSFCPSSKHSTFSTLTDEYVHYYDVPRRTGITAVAEEREGHNSNIVAASEQEIPQIQRSESGPVDVDTNEILPSGDEESFQYATSSLACPPPPASPKVADSSQNWIVNYGNSEHLSSIIQYPSADGGSGDDGEGYVDEEAAMRYATLHESRRGRCYKPLIWGAVLLLAVSLASVTFGVFLQKDSNTQSNGSLLATEDDEKDGDLFPSVPELTIEEPINPPTEVPSMRPSPKPSSKSSKPTIAWSESVPAITESSDAPSKRPTLNPLPFPSSSPIGVTTSPTPLPSPSPSSSPIEVTTSPTPLPSPSPSDKPSPYPSPPPQSSKPSASPTFPSQTDGDLQTYTTKTKVSRDTYIKQNSSQWTYGTSNYLRVDREPRSIAVLAFDINPNRLFVQSSKRNDETSGTQSEPNSPTSTQVTYKVKEARLRLYALEASETGGDINALTNAKKWKESDLTWENARDEVNANGEVYIRSIEGQIYDGLWYNIDVTKAFDCCVRTVGPTRLDLLIRSESDDGVTYASREYEDGKYAPELILTYSIDMSSPNVDPPPSYEVDFVSLPPFMSANNQSVIETEQSYSPTSNPSYIEESAGPTYFPSMSDSLDIRATNSPLETRYVPESCENEVDSHFPSTLGPIQESALVKVLFPTKDLYVRGGDYKDHNFGSSDVLELAGSSNLSHARKIVIEFDLTSLSNSSSQINALTLRVFVESVGLDYLRSVSVFKLPRTIDWDEYSLTWASFGTPAVEQEGHHPHQVTLEDRKQWIDIDITGFVDRDEPLSNLSLVLQNLSTGVGNSRIQFASRETCYSPKLVAVTEPI